MYMKILPVNYYNTYRPQPLKKDNVQNEHKCNAEYQQIPSSTIRANFIPVFGSLERTDKYNGTPLNSGFYRDYPTLINSVGVLTEIFPEGADILVGACSSGEDLISLYSLMPQSDRFNFVGFDTSKDALEIADRNIYSVVPEYGDGFLLEKPKDKLAKIMTNCFWNVMEKTDKPDFELNKFPTFIFDANDMNSEDKNLYCRVKDIHRKNLTFENCDIRQINEYNPDKKAGAIFFRNALYLLTGNHLSSGILNAKEGHNIYFNKTECLNSVVDSVYEKLDNGGIFVLGEIPAEHVYLADKFTPKKDRIKIDNVEMFNDDIDYYMADPDAEIYKVSPLYKALKRNGRFKPLCYTTVFRNSYHKNVPTIWQKNK